MDIVDTATRSRMMARIRGRDTKPELRLRRALHARGFRFQVYPAKLPGRPDIVLPRWRVAIQVHGCFWHRHRGCRYTTTPATRREFWDSKFTETVRRDQKQLTALKERGWRVAVVWECGLKGHDIELLVNALETWIRTSSDDTVELQPVAAPLPM